MSCFVVPDFHVDVLVSWAVLHKAPAFFDGLGPRTLAAVLAEANRAAYRERYGEQPEPAAAYEPRDAARLMTCVQVIKACDCLEYQCSDWSDWEGSTAERSLVRIREHAIRLLPGYEEAAWSLDEVAA